MANSIFQCLTLFKHNQHVRLENKWLIQKTFKTISEEGIVSKINTLCYWSEGKTWNEAVSTLHSKNIIIMGGLSSKYWKKLFNGRF